MTPQGGEGVEEKRVQSGYRYIVTFKVGSQRWVREELIKHLRPSEAVSRAFSRIAEETDETFWQLNQRQELTIVVERSS